MEFVNFGIRASDLKMNALMKMYLRRCLCIYMALYFISCTPSHSQQSFLIKDTISNIKKVAIIASANSPDVTYESGNFDTAIAFFILLGAIPAIAVTVDDNYQASNLKEKIYLSSIDDKIINAFIDPLRKASCFDRFDYIKQMPNNDRQLLDEGYDAFIILGIKSILLAKRYGNLARLQIHVQGHMKALHSGKTIWNRLEVVTDPEMHTLEYYKTNGLRDLDAVLEKAGQVLAYDFVYLK